MITSAADTHVFKCLLCILKPKEQCLYKINFSIYNCNQHHDIKQPTYKLCLCMLLFLTYTLYHKLTQTRFRNCKVTGLYIHKVGLKLCRNGSCVVDSMLACVGFNSQRMSHPNHIQCRRSKSRSASDNCSPWWCTAHAQ